MIQKDTIFGSYHIYATRRKTDYILLVYKAQKVCKKFAWLFYT